MSLSSRLLLGSSSPRRQEILRYFSIPFEVAVSHFDEDSIVFDGNPSSYVQKLASEKGLAVSAKNKDAVVLTADTAVFLDGKVFNKPTSEEEAFSFLKHLSGRWHTVVTGVAVTKNLQTHTLSEETKVLLHPLSDDEIRKYMKAFHVHDKAGGYLIQKGGGLIVARIDGCYYNVVGLPLNSCRILLAQHGIHLWDYLKD